ncbi:YciI family protein [Fictibacillus nanhaiensis]|uniref:YciI family protein n=1 Tax=Fictibacillus nanhaiensis TaxID=742169 RepID=UPI001C9620B1|nr:YciI family protein [Fictibacillus nanhaiensis]MBY6035984.1 YciI family protein [Fictibacillus nanhaiensis]
MRYMLIVKATGYTEAGVKYSPEYDNAVKAYKKTLARAGVLLGAEKLHPSSSGVKIVYPSHGGKPEVNAGPFSTEQEMIASFTLIEVSSEVEAAEWALQMPVPKGMGLFEIEIRKLEEETEPIHDPMKAHLEEQFNLLKNL